MWRIAVPGKVEGEEGVKEVLVARSVGCDWGANDEDFLILY